MLLKTIVYAVYFQILFIVTIVNGKRYRIITGDYVKPDSFPYQVMILSEIELNSKSRTQICGGTIISNTHVLTSAHCFYFDGSFTNQTKLFAGVTFIPFKNSTSLERFKQKFGLDVDVVFTHPSYFDYEQHNDIAIVKTNKHFQFSKIVKKVNLPERQYENVVCNVSGWGSALNKRSQHLQSIQVHLLSVKWCEENITKQFSIKNYPYHVICSTQSDKGTCHGDLGSAAVYNNQIVGIVSQRITFGGCHHRRCIGDGFDIYTNVYKYVDWIQSAINGQPYENAEFKLSGDSLASNITPILCLFIFIIPALFVF